MTTLTVDVTQDDIDNGEPVNGNHCAVALALIRATGDPYVSCGIATASWYVGGDVKYVCLPTKATDFIDAFDEGEPVEPFSFEVEVVE